MGDLSTREQIRGEAFRRVFDVMTNRCRHNGAWSQAWDACVDCHQLATDAVDALGDLLPTGIEWGVRYEAPDITPRMDNPSGISTHTRPLPNEAHARAAVENGAPIRVSNRRAVSRYAHDWTEVTA